MFTWTRADRVKYRLAWFAGMATYFGFVGQRAAAGFSAASRTGVVVAGRWTHRGAGVPTREWGSFVVRVGDDQVELGPTRAAVASIDLQPGTYPILVRPYPILSPSKRQHPVPGQDLIGEAVVKSGQTLLIEVSPRQRGLIRPRAPRLRVRTRDAGITTEVTGDR